MLAQGWDLAPRVPAVLLPMPAGAMLVGVCIFVKLLTFRRAYAASLGRKDNVLGHAQAISCPGSRETKPVRCWQTTRRPPGLQISPRVRYSDLHITVPPFEGQSQTCSLCGRSPLLDIRYVLAGIFFLFFWGEISCFPSYVRQ